MYNTAESVFKVNMGGHFNMCVTSHIQHLHDMGQIVLSYFAPELPLKVLRVLQVYEFCIL